MFVHQHLHDRKKEKHDLSKRKLRLRINIQISLLEVTSLLIGRVINSSTDSSAFRIPSIIHGV